MDVQIRHPAARCVFHESHAVGEADQSEVGQVHVAGAVERKSRFPTGFIRHQHGPARGIIGAAPDGHRIRSIAAVQHRENHAVGQHVSARIHADFIPGRKRIPIQYGLNGKQRTVGSIPVVGGGAVGRRKDIARSVPIVDVVNERPRPESERWTGSGIDDAGIPHQHDSPQCHGRRFRRAIPDIRRGIDRQAIGRGCRQQPSRAVVPRKLDADGVGWTQAAIQPMQFHPVVAGAAIAQRQGQETGMGGVAERCLGGAAIGAEIDAAAVVWRLVGHCPHGVARIDRPGRVGRDRPSSVAPIAGLAPQMEIPGRWIHEQRIIHETVLVPPARLPLTEIGIGDLFGRVGAYNRARRQLIQVVIARNGGPGPIFDVERHGVGRAHDAVGNLHPDAGPDGALGIAPERAVLDQIAAHAFAHVAVIAIGPDAAILELHPAAAGNNQPIRRVVVQLHAEQRGAGDVLHQHAVEAMRDSEIAHLDVSRVQEVNAVCGTIAHQQGAAGGVIGAAQDRQRHFNGAGVPVANRHRGRMRQRVRAGIDENAVAGAHGEVFEETYQTVHGR